MEQLNPKASMPTLFITGAGRRLGLHLVECYLSKGWRVIAHYNSKNELPAELQARYAANGQYVAIPADLSSLTEVKSLIEEVIGFLKQHGGELDAVIHNASCFWPDSDELSIDQQWRQQEKQQAVHMTAPQTLTWALVKFIKKSGCILAITDIYVELPNSRFASYCSAKAGLQSLALSWAQLFAPDVRVNIIQPGPVKFLPEHNEQYREKVLSQSLLGKELGYDAIQQGIDYLINATALTGSILKVDGGRSCVNYYEQQINNY